MKLKDNPAIKLMARKLGLGKPRNAEEAIREYCVQEVQKIIKRLGKIAGLDQFLNIVSSSLGIKFEEINDDADLQTISRKYVERGEIAFADLHRQLDDKTDATLAILHNRKSWEHRYVAVIDCRGLKKTRAYFSKWHEVGHVLTTSEQAEFQFRRTPADKRKDPEEAIVDRVAGDLAFYSPLFLPELLCIVGEENRLTFEMIERLRNTVCKEASREATIRAAVTRCPHPQLFIIADYGLKKKEERDLQQAILSFGEEIPVEPKLRALAVIGSATASETGLWIYGNMEVPHGSVIYKAFENSLSTELYSNVENLGWWKHSKGQLPETEIMVEAKRSGNRVFALISRKN